MHRTHSYNVVEKGVLLLSFLGSLSAFLPLCDPQIYK